MGPSDKLVAVWTVTKTSFGEDSAYKSEKTHQLQRITE